MSISHALTRKSVQVAIDEISAKKTHCRFSGLTRSHKARLIEFFIKVTRAEIESLVTMFKTITKNLDRMDRLKFRDVLHNSFDMTDDILMDRVFRAFDRDNDSFLSMSEWVESLSIFLRGTQEEKIKCAFFMLDCFSSNKFRNLFLFLDAFTVYDLNGDGYISREEMFQMLKTSIIKVSSGKVIFL